MDKTKKMQRLVEINRRKKLIKELFEDHINFSDVVFIVGTEPDPEIYDTNITELSIQQEISEFKREDDDSHVIYKHLRYTGIENIFGEIDKNEAYNFIFKKFKSAIYKTNIFKEKKVLFSFHYQDRYWRISIQFDSLINLFNLICKKIYYHEIIIIDEKNIRNTLGIYLSEYFVELRCSV